MKTTTKKPEDQINETLAHAKEAMKNVNDTTAKAMDEYITLGLQVQDEMFKMAQQQLNGFRQYTEFAVKQQSEFFAQFEKNAKHTRELWIDGLRKWQDTCKTLADKE